MKKKRDLHLKGLKLKKKMSFEYLFRVTKDKESIIDFFQEQGVLRPKDNPFLCPVESCKKAMTWTKKKILVMVMPGCAVSTINHFRFEQDLFLLVQN